MLHVINLYTYACYDVHWHACRKPSVESCLLCRFGDEASQGWMGYFGQALKTSANYLPSQVTDMLNQGRDFAFARMPTCGLANVCAVAKLVNIV